MKYRVRMSQGKWFVRVYNENSALVPEECKGPFSAISEAYDAADRTKYADWDKISD